jgi:hypothetical protein
MRGSATPRAVSARCAARRDDQLGRHALERRLQPLVQRGVDDAEAAAHKHHEDLVARHACQVGYEARVAAERDARGRDRRFRMRGRDDRSRLA